MKTKVGLNTIEGQRLKSEENKRRKIEYENLPDPEYDALTDRQKIVFGYAMSNESVFFTGRAGTGKSHVTSLIKARQTSPFWHFTGSTGIAAVNIGGTTLHAFMGLGLMDDELHVLIGKLEKRRDAKKRILACRCLVIDEVSMISADLFDMVDKVLRHVRKCELPFGGIQVVATGDFMQLPPVGKSEKMCFKADCWGPLFGSRQILLHEVLRQEEGIFLDLLDGMRVAERDLPFSFRYMLTRLAGQIFPNDGIEPTKLYSKNCDVRSENLQRLDELPGPYFKYVADDICDQNPAGRKALEAIEKSCLAPTELILKEGAQVMLLKNLDSDRGLVNGSRGFVAGFKTISEYLDAPSVDANDNIQHRMAVSSAIDRAGTEDVKWPIVRFANGEEEMLTTYRGLWTTAGGKLPDSVLARRFQIPLTLAWALTIHKSQGQTLDRVVCDLSECFDAGQAYVAMSRVRKMEHIKVLSFDPEKIFCNKEALAFYKALESS